MKNHSSCYFPLLSAAVPSDSTLLLARVPQMTCYMLDPVKKPQAWRDRPLADCTHVQQCTKLVESKISHTQPRVGSYVSRALC